MSEVSDCKISMYTKMASCYLFYSNGILGGKPLHNGKHNSQFLSTYMF